MWAMVIGLYGIAKWLTWRALRPLSVPASHAAAYWFGWPGLDAREFLMPRERPGRPQKAEWVFATAKLLMGFSLLRSAIGAAAGAVVGALAGTAKADPTVEDN